MMNCEGTSQATQAAKEKAAQEAAEVANRLGLDAALLAKILLSLIGALIDALGARRRRELVDAYMDAALREYERIKNATSTAGNSSSSAGPGSGSSGVGGPGDWWNNGVGTRPGGTIDIGGWGEPYTRPGTSGGQTADFYDPLRPPPGTDGSGAGGNPNQPGLPWGSVPGPDGLPIDDYVQLDPLDPNDPFYGLPSPVLPGIPITPDELADYYNGVHGCDDYKFWILGWLHPDDDAALVLDAMSWAKRMHRSIILPVARHYHLENFGSFDGGGCLTQIRYGILSAPLTRSRLGAGPTSRKLANQSVNFSVLGVKDEVIVDDIAKGKIEGLRAGTFGVSSGGVHCSLPFYIAAEVVERLKLYKVAGVPDYIGYSWTD